PLAARAHQQPMPVIGFLHIASPGAYVHVVAGLRRGLSEADFVEGRNVTVEYRWGEGKLGRNAFTAGRSVAQSGVRNCRKPPRSTGSQERGCDDPRRLFDL